jgi:hypothetical protein
MTSTAIESRYSSAIHDDETTFMQSWVADLLDWKKPVFSFRYDDQPGEMLAAQPAERATGEWVDDARLHTLSWRDEATGLVCTLEVTEYRDFPAVEWLNRAAPRKQFPISSYQLCATSMWKGLP